MVIPTYGQSNFMVNPTYGQSDITVNPCSTNLHQCFNSFIFAEMRLENIEKYLHLTKAPAGT